MAAFQSADPALAARVYGLIESGLSSEDVAKALVEDNVSRHLSKTEGSRSFAEETEVFADEIRVIAQALAYRQATAEDIPEVARLLEAAYAPEVQADGAEAFRVGAAVSLDSVEALFADASYLWQVVEAPSGRDVELDGVILGCCCYSTDGVSRRNGEVEGPLGSIRYMAVLPRFQGVCVGLRLLRKIEQLMEESGCVRAMACVPSTRVSMASWLGRRGFRLAGKSPYPAGALGHELRSDTPSVQLDALVKALEGAVAAADGKKAKSTVLGAAVPPQPPVVPGKMHLPPHWRYPGAAGAKEASADEAEPKGPPNAVAAAADDDIDIPLD